MFVWSKVLSQLCWDSLCSCWEPFSSTNSRRHKQSQGAHNGWIALTVIDRLSRALARSAGPDSSCKRSDAHTSRRPAVQAERTKKNCAQPTSQPIPPDGGPENTRPSASRERVARTGSPLRWSHSDKSMR